MLGQPSVMRTCHRACYAGARRPIRSALSAKVLLAGWMAREMGGEDFAQFFASLTTLIANLSETNNELRNEIFDVRRDTEVQITIGDPNLLLYEYRWKGITVANTAEYDAIIAFATALKAGGFGAAPAAAFGAAVPAAAAQRTRERQSG
jgi:hypothetical protein